MKRKMQQMAVCCCEDDDTSKRFEHFKAYFGKHVENKVEDIQNKV